MRLCPFAVWGFNLAKKDLFLAVKLFTMLTHSNILVIQASQLYCYAITLLIKGYSLIDVFNMIKREVTLPVIKQWFEHEIEAGDKNKLTRPNSDD